MADVQHSGLTDPQLHEPKGVAAAASGTVYVATGAGSGSWTTPSSSISNEVIVQSASDFPTAVSDVITLASDTVYLLDGAIDVGNDRFVLAANTAIIGLTGSISSITTTTTGSVFTATGSFHFDRFKLTAASGTVFSCTGGGTEQAFIREFSVNSASSIGTFTNWSFLNWVRGFITTATTGLVVTGTCGTLVLQEYVMVAGYTTGLDISGGTFTTLAFLRCGFVNASATTHMKVAASSGNLSAGNEGRIQLCKFDTGATNIVQNLDKGDIRWQVLENIGLQDSVKNAQGYMHTSTTTTIGIGDGDAGNPKMVNGSTNWVDAASNQFTVSTGGRFTYIGTNAIDVLVSCNISGATASGTANIAHYIAKNGTAITASKTSREYTSTAIGSPAPCAALATLETNDYVELYVENETGTNDWDGEVLNFIVGKV